MQTNTKNSSRKGWDFGLIGLVVAFLGLLIVLVVFLVRKYREKKGITVSNPNSKIDVKEVDDSDLTQVRQKEIFRDIYESALNLGFNSEASLAIAGQSCHETGRWRSELAQNYNNIFGMKDGGAGEGVQSGVAKGFATYKDWDDSLLDYSKWCKAKGYPFEENLNVEQHLQWLKSKKYFEDTLLNYKTSVLSLIKELS